MAFEILCYGDSNTWGYSVEGDEDDRYPFHERWPNVMAMELGANYHVTPEGLNGRTTVFADPVEGAFLNGRSTLLPVLKSHYPLDLVMILLGTNDCKAQLHNSAFEIAQGVGALIDDTKSTAFGRSGRAPDVLVIAPPPLLKGEGRLVPISEGEIAISQGLAANYQVVSSERGVKFFDAGQVVVTSPTDGVHFSRQSHMTLGRALAEFVGRNWRV